MAIPFQFPPEDDTTQLQMTLEALLVELFQVLNQLAPSTPGGAPAQGAAVQQPRLPPVAAVSGSTRTSAALSNLATGFKTGAPTSPPTSGGSPAGAAAGEQQVEAWRRLGAELRTIADQFSHKRQRLLSEGSSPPLGVVNCKGSPLLGSRSRSATPRSLGSRILGLLLPRTLGCSAALVIFGLRFLKSRLS